MKTYKECKDIVAAKWGFPDGWDTIDWYGLDYSHHEDPWYKEFGRSEYFLMYQVARLYAIEAVRGNLSIAASNAKVKIECKVIGWVLGDVHVVDRESITNIEILLP